MPLSQKPELIHDLIFFLFYFGIRNEALVEYLCTKRRRCDEMVAQTPMCICGTLSMFICRRTPMFIIYIYIIWNSSDTSSAAFQSCFLSFLCFYSQYFSVVYRFEKQNLSKYVYRRRRVFFNVWMCVYSELWRYTRESEGTPWVLHIQHTVLENAQIFLYSQSNLMKLQASKYVNDLRSIFV